MKSNQHGIGRIGFADNDSDLIDTKRISKNDKTGCCPRYQRNEGLGGPCQCPRCVGAKPNGRVGVDDGNRLTGLLSIAGACAVKDRRQTAGQLDQPDGCARRVAGSLGSSSERALAARSEFDNASRINRARK